MMAPPEPNRTYPDQLDAARRQIKEAYNLLQCARMNLDAARRKHEVIKLDQILLDIRMLQNWTG